MGNLTGTNIAAAIRPFTEEDKFATHEAKFGKGGLRTIEKKADLFLIPIDRQEAGMEIYVVEEDKKYRLMTTNEILTISNYKDLSLEINNSNQNNNTVANPGERFILSSSYNGLIQDKIIIFSFLSPIEIYFKKNFKFSSIICKEMPITEDLKLSVIIDSVFVGFIKIDIGENVGYFVSTDVIHLRQNSLLEIFIDMPYETECKNLVFSLVGFDSLETLNSY